jgi:hypothetical protein
MMAALRLTQPAWKYVLAQFHSNGSNSDIGNGKLSGGMTGTPAEAKASAAWTMVSQACLTGGIAFAAVPAAVSPPIVSRG